MSYYWTGSGPLRRGRENDDWIDPGESFEPTEGELESFGDLIEERDGDSEGEDVEEDEPELPDPPFDPSEHSVSELREKLDSSEYSDAELQALEAAERESGDRTTALEAITGIR